MPHLSSRHQGQQVRNLIHGVIPVGSISSIFSHCCRSRLSAGAGTGKTDAGCVKLSSEAEGLDPLQAYAVHECKTRVGIAKHSKKCWVPMYSCACSIATWCNRGWCSSLLFWPPRPGSPRRPEPCIVDHGWCSFLWCPRQRLAVHLLCSATAARVHLHTTGALPCHASDAHAEPRTFVSTRLAV